LSNIQGIFSQTESFNLGFMGVNYSIPNKIDRFGNDVPISSNLLETSIKFNSFTFAKDIEIREKRSSKIVLPRYNAIGFHEFMNWLKSEAEKYDNTQPKNKEVIKDVTNNRS
jgi:hypothetical protein